MESHLGENKAESASLLHILYILLLSPEQSQFAINGKGLNERAQKGCRMAGVAESNCAAIHDSQSAPNIPLL